MLTMVVRHENKIKVVESESGDYLIIQFGNVVEIELNKSFVRVLSKLLIQNLHDSGWNLTEIKKIIESEDKHKIKIEE